VASKNNSQPHPPVLVVKGLAHRYPGQQRGLGPVDLELAPRRVVALVGPNGAGKSTLLRLLAGVLLPRRGSIELAGKPLGAWNDRQRARCVALAPQRTSLAFAFTVREYVGFGAYASGRRASGAAVEQALQTMDLRALADRPLPQLSVGQQQRASLARALAQLGTGDLQGRVLLADEPASSLDTDHAGRLVQAIRAMVDRGLALVVAAHDLPWASAVADEGLAIAADGSATCLRAEDLRDPASLARVFAARFERYEAPSGRVVALPDYTAQAATGPGEMG